MDNDAKITQSKINWINSLNGFKTFFAQDISVWKMLKCVVPSLLASF